MIKNYIKTAVRNFWRNPLYSVINIVGLSTGMMCSVLVVLFVKNELSYDSFHEKASQLYRITTTVTNKEGERNTTGASGQVQGPAFKAAIPEIENYLRFWNVGGFNIIGGQKSLIQQGMFADSSFFVLLSFPLLFGDAHSALRDPFSIVVTESTALKYFGRKDVIGQTLKVEEQGFQALTVTAVAKDVPTNSSVQFDVLLSFQFLEKFFKDEFWLNQYLSTFVLLSPGADPRHVEKKFDAVFQAKARKQLSDPKMSDGFSTQVQFGLQPFSEVHLNSYAIQNESGIRDGSTYTTLYLLLAIAAFILLMACINFVNLNLAHSLKRAKEIGIRKVNGSSRLQIVLQFLLEAAFLCGAAFVLALIFSKTFLPLFNSLIGRRLELDFFLETEIWIAWLSIIAISIMAAGLYPAMLVSRFKTTEVLYGKQNPRTRHWFGKSLIVLQFTLAIGLMAAATVYYLQMDFILKSDLGYNPSGIIKLQLPPQRDPDKLVKFFRNELENEPAVLEVSGENSWGEGNRVKINGKEIISLKLRIDEHYLPVLEIPLINGRNFSPAFSSDSMQSVLVNETFVRAAGLKEPIGQQVKLPGEWEGDLEMNIIGVVKDYHHNSLKEKIGPAVFVMKHYENLFVKSRNDKSLQALATLEKIYKLHLGDSPVQVSFLEDDISKQYDEEKNWQRVINYATAMSVFICCLGLFGLSWLAARQRTREIGIRKVLGAGVGAIAAMLSKDFLKLVLISFFIACPITWVLMDHWLQDYAYRIPISWWMFALAGLVGFLIAMLTVGSQAIKAALANPVESLRTE